MNAIHMCLWGLAGIALAFISLLTQTWSVKRISPDHPGWSVTLVVGGAFFRWLVISSVLVFALKNSLLAALIVLITFLAVRTLLLIPWKDFSIHRLLRADHSKD